ncbi:uncharacterized protein KY384_004912 [Bacidia gigantensis]|uniref:uncharacterized protein n=1 Tax=Bacidia gigantensis TaxID=2732470 RepID=UPI001D047941|nr:uncharacterized protein KY384_004912 [Bacidia gigantensis]KAG8530410.1 hypothetical protein KY384_004912 [Bacidia gigantensis]
MSYTSYQRQSGSEFSTITDQIDPYARERGCDRECGGRHDFEDDDELQAIDVPNLRPMADLRDYPPSRAYEDYPDIWQSPQGSSSPIPIPHRPNQADLNNISGLSLNSSQGFNAYPWVDESDMAGSAAHSSDHDASSHMWSPRLPMHGFQDLESTATSDHDSFDNDALDEQERMKSQDPNIAGEGSVVEAGVRMDYMELEDMLSHSVPVESTLGQNHYHSSYTMSPHHDNNFAALGDQFVAMSNTSIGAQYDTSAPAVPSGLYVPTIRANGGARRISWAEPHDIVDRRSSEKWQGDIAGSFPPTKGHFTPMTKPPTSPKKGNASQQITKARLRGSMSQSRVSDVPVNRKTSKGRRRSSGSVCSVQAPNRPLGSIPEGMEMDTREEIAIIDLDVDPVLPASLDAKPNRKRPYTSEQKEKVNWNRKNAQNCINCVSNKTGCDQRSYPCGRCEKARKGIPCVVARWLEYFDKVPSNGTFHLTLSTATSGRPLQAIIQIPDTFPLPALLQFLCPLRGRYHIRVEHVNSQSYLIDAGECYTRLSQKIARMSKQKQDLELGDFFDSDKSMGKSAASDWSQVVIPPKEMTDVERLIHWTLMPSRATYRLVPVSGVSPHQYLNINDSRQLKYAAMLNRLVLRAVEKLGHAQLQSQCMSLPQTTGKVDTATLNSQMHSTTCVLRLRYSFLLAHEPSTFGQPFDHSNAVSHLRKMLRVLYYWCFKTAEAAAKRGNFSGSEFADGQNYLVVDNRRIMDPLPDIENDDGFDAWLDQGRHVLQGAGLGANHYISDNAFGSSTYGQQYPSSDHHHFPQSWIAHSNFF